MKVYTAKLLNTFGWLTIDEFLLSLAPSFKYKINIALMIISSVWVSLDKWFGLDNAAFIFLVAVFVMELLSGVTASRIRKEKLSSIKLSRFTLKLCCYMVLIGFSNTMYLSFKHHNSDVTAIVWDWFHVFLIMHIGFENSISILENMAVISGKDKSVWIKKIEETLDKFSV